MASVGSDNRKGGLKSINSERRSKETIIRILLKMCLSYKRSPGNCLKLDLTHFRGQKFGKMNPIVVNRARRILRDQ